MCRRASTRTSHDSANSGTEFRCPPSPRSHDPRDRCRSDHPAYLMTNTLRPASPDKLSLAVRSDPARGVEFQINPPSRSPPCRRTRHPGVRGNSDTSALDEFDAYCHTSHVSRIGRSRHVALSLAEAARRHRMTSVIADLTALEPTHTRVSGDCRDLAASTAG